MVLMRDPGKHKIQGDRKLHTKTLPAWCGGLPSPVQTQREVFFSSSPPDGHLLSNPKLCTAWKNGMNTRSTLCFVFITKQWFIRYKQSITAWAILLRVNTYAQTHTHIHINAHVSLNHLSVWEEWSHFSSSYQNLWSCASFGNMEPPAF